MSWSKQHLHHGCVLPVRVPADVDLEGASAHCPQAPHPPLGPPASPAHSHTFRPSNQGLLLPRAPTLRGDASVPGSHWKAFPGGLGQQRRKGACVVVLFFFHLKFIKQMKEGRQIDKKSTQQLLVVFQVIPQIFYNVFNTFVLLKYLNYENS